MMFRLEYW